MGQDESILDFIHHRTAAAGDEAKQNEPMRAQQPAWAYAATMCHVLPLIG